MTSTIIPLHSENRFFRTHVSGGLAFFDSARCRFVFGDAGSYSYTHQPRNIFFNPMARLMTRTEAKRAWDAELEEFMRIIAAGFQVPWVSKRRLYESDSSDVTTRH